MLAAVIFAVAALMTMTGRGGGNFFVLVLALAGTGMHLAATTGQFILIVSSFTASLLFGKNRVTDWKLVGFIGTMTLVSAFLGGFFSDIVNDRLMKVVFAAGITLASLMMLRPARKKPRNSCHSAFEIRSGSTSYGVNPLLTVPAVLATGFLSGMVGISGGSFLVPLMVLAIDVPMHTAVGTSTTLVTVTAGAGFLGHLSTGHFDCRLALPLALAGLIGALLGARLTLKIAPAKLKLLFAVTSLLAAAIMLATVF